MKLVYGMRLDGPQWTDSQHQDVCRVVANWIEGKYPFAERGAGVSVRLDDENPSHWWRYTVDATLGGGVIATTVITIATQNFQTSLEVRLSVVPGGTRVNPHPTQVSPTDVRILATKIVRSCLLFDAGMRLRDTAHIVSDDVGAQNFAAFCEAPSRALPIVIETASGSNSSVFSADKLSLSLTGLAHVVQLFGESKRLAFNAIYGSALLVPQGLTIVWPTWPTSLHRTFVGHGLKSAGAVNARMECIQLITQAAADSLAPLRSPRFRRQIVQEIVQESLVDPTFVKWDEYRAALDGWQVAEEEISELEQALAEADRMIAEKQQLLEKDEVLVDRLVLQNTEFAIRLGKSPTNLVASDSSDAVRQAVNLCENLIFHPQAQETARELSGIDATHLLKDLVRLNIVAGDWQSGRINKTSLTISCRSLGLNYAAGISDTAENKYSADYAFLWRGRTEYAVAHIRHGKGTKLYRVHIFFDDDSHQVVVAYIGRHLRDKASHN